VFSATIEFSEGALTMSNDVTLYRAGAARVCITPELPCEMAGYFHSRIAESVARDLYASALAIEADGECVVIVATDLIAMTDELCMPAFEEASRKYGIPLSNFVACASHTHTGPEVRRGSHIPCCENAIPSIAERISEAVLNALENRFDAVVCVGATPAPGLAHNRLSRCADGSEIFGRQFAGSKVIGPAGPEDDSVQVLSVYDTNKALRAVAVNFACHPDLSGGGSAKAIDADWPGEMCEHLMQVRGSEVVCLFLQGTAGDINQSDPRAAEPRWLPDGRNCVARGVAGAALYAMEVSRPLVGPGLAALRRELDVPFYVRDQVLLDLVAQLKAKGEEATYFEKNLIRKVDGWPNDGKVDQFGLNCLRVGDVALVALPGEIFTGWGLEIKRYSPAAMTFVVELARSDGLTGYKATTDQCIRGARAKGAYGALPTLSQKHCPAAGQMMTEAAIEMLHGLWGN